VPLTHSLRIVEEFLRSPDVPRRKPTMRGIDRRAENAAQPAFRSVFTES
jgi:hypothetical protein